METMEFEVLLYSIKLSEEEKQRVEQLVEDLLYYSLLAFQEGILVLENELDSALLSLETPTEEYLFLQDVVRMMCDAMEAEILKELLERKIVMAGTNTLKGYLYFIIAEWAQTLLHLIVSSKRWSIIEEMLFTFVDSNRREELKKRFLKHTEKRNSEKKKHYFNLIDHVCPKNTSNPFIEVFEAKVAELSDPMIQKLLTGIKNERQYIPTLLAFCNKGTRDLIFKNMSLESILNNAENIINASDEYLTIILENTLRLLQLLESMEKNN